MWFIFPVLSFFLLLSRDSVLVKIGEVFLGDSDIHIEGTNLLEVLTIH